MQDFANYLDPKNAHSWNEVYRLDELQEAASSVYISEFGFPEAMRPSNMDKALVGNKLVIFDTEWDIEFKFSDDFDFDGHPGVAYFSDFGSRMMCPSRLTSQSGWSTPPNASSTTRSDDAMRSQTTLS